MSVKAAFVGASGATLSHVLAWTLLAGHRAAARKSLSPFFIYFDLQRPL
jgi:hypothetical protein